MLENVVELVAGNVSVFVDVVDLKGEFELFVFFALNAEVGKSFDELVEVNFAVVVWRGGWGRRRRRRRRSWRRKRRSRWGMRKRRRNKVE